MLKMFKCEQDLRIGTSRAIAGSPFVADSESLYIQALADNGLITELSQEPENNGDGKLPCREPSLHPISCGLVSQQC